MNDFAGVDAYNEKAVRLSGTVNAFDLGKLCTDRWHCEIDGHLPEVVQLPLVRHYSLSVPVGQADNGRSAFCVCEGDDRRREVARFQEDALPVEPLIFGGRYEEASYIVPCGCKGCLNLVDRHGSTLNFFK